MCEESVLHVGLLQINKCIYSFMLSQYVKVLMGLGSVGIKSICDHLYTVPRS